MPALCRSDACLDGVILDGRNGWLYKSEDDYLEKLYSFMSSTEMQKNMSERAAKLARQMFSSAVFAEKVERVYLDVLYGTAEKKAVTCLGEMSC